MVSCLIGVKYGRRLLTHVMNWCPQVISARTESYPNELTMVGSLGGNDSPLGSCWQLLSSHGKPCRRSPSEKRCQRRKRRCDMVMGGGDMVVWMLTNVMNRSQDCTFCWLIYIHMLIQIYVPVVCAYFCYCVTDNVIFMGVRVWVYLCETLTIVNMHRCS